MKRLWSRLERFTLLAGVVGIIYGAMTWLIDYRISRPEYVSTVASQVRPSVIINSHGHIISDSGGLEYIDPNIVVEFKEPYSPEFSPVPKRIILKARKLLHEAPIMTAMDDGILIHTRVKGGNGFEWDYEIESIENLSRFHDVVGPFRIRIEIIR